MNEIEDYICNYDTDEIIKEFPLMTYVEFAEKMRTLNYCHPDNKRNRFMNDIIRCHFYGAYKLLYEHIGGIEANNSIILDHRPYWQYYALYNDFAPYHLTESRAANRIDAIEDIKKNIEGYKRLLDVVADDKSKDFVISVLAFRLTGQLEYIDKLRGQYIESFPYKKNFDMEFVKKGNSEVYIDVGGYQGETVLDYIKYNPEYKGVIYIEPDKQNFNKGMKNLKNVSKAALFNCGLDSENKTVNMTECKAMSRISSGFTEEEKIEIKTLDSIGGEIEGRYGKPTFIKMDIEGSEYGALCGGTSAIRNWLPSLEISTYHLVEDFLRLPILVDDLFEKKYNIYVRAYGYPIPFMTIYAIKKE